jgi:hypothetical protein
MHTVQALREQAEKQEHHLQEEAIGACGAESGVWRSESLRGHPQPAQPAHQQTAGKEFFVVVCVVFFFHIQTCFWPNKQSVYSVDIYETYPIVVFVQHCFNF